MAWYENEAFQINKMYKVYQLATKTMKLIIEYKMQVLHFIHVECTNRRNTQLTIIVNSEDTGTNYILTVTNDNWTAQPDLDGQMSVCRRLSVVSSF